MNRPNLPAANQPDVPVVHHQPDDLRQRFRHARLGRWTAVAVVLLVVVSCGDSPTDPPPVEPTDRVEVVSTEWNDGVVGSEIPITVRATRDGAPLSDAQLLFTVDGGSSSIAPAAITTDPQGRAVATWTVGTLAGSQTIEVRMTGADPLILTVEALAGPAVDFSLTPDTLKLSAYREQNGFEPAFTDQYGNRASDPDGLEWSLLDPDVVTLETDGSLTAATGGTARIRAMWEGIERTAIATFAPRGALTVTFDDGYRSAFTNAFPIVQNLGLRANVAVVTRSVDESWEDFMTLEHVETVHDAGWAVVSHTVHHPNLVNLSLAEVEEELVASRDWIEAHGFRGSEVFVVPFHSWGERERTLVVEHYEMARGMEAIEFEPDTLVTWIPDDPYALTAYDAEFAPVDTAEGRASFRAFLAHVVEEGLFLDLFFHRVEDDMVDGFTQTMDIIAEFSDYVITYDEVRDRFRSSSAWKEH